MSTPLRGQWSLVTGASSGIGREVARELARLGSHLGLVARDRSRLESTAAELARDFGGRAEVLVADLANPDSPAALGADLAARGIAIDVLVNNAGVGAWGDFAHTSLADERRLVELNVLAYMALTKLVLPGMLARRRGRILNVPSTAAFFPGPHMSAYYASKAFVLSFSQAVASEVSGSGVTVTCLCPGPTRTRFAEGQDMRLFHSPLVLDARPVARAGVNGMLAGRRVVVPGAFNWLLEETARISPRRLAEAIVGYLNRPPGGSSNTN
jgi:short-subunit dehydrogenase